MKAIFEFRLASEGKFDVAIIYKNLKYGIEVRIFLKLQQSDGNSNMFAFSFSLLNFTNSLTV